MKQRIWRHANMTSHSGWFGWDIYEVTDADLIDMTKKRNQNMYMPTLDGGLITVGVMHSFDPNSMARYTAGDDWVEDKYFEVINV